MEVLTIGKLAEKAEVGVETIRFYERKSLIKKPTSKIGAFRVYPDEAVSKIKFIKKAQSLGFTLKEIKELIALDQNTKTTCGDVAEKASIKLTEVREKIQDLKKMEEAINKLLNACEKNNNVKACCKVSDCFENKCS